MKTKELLIGIVLIQSVFMVAFGFKHELLKAELNSVIEASPVKHVSVCRIA